MNRRLIMDIRHERSLSFIVNYLKTTGYVKQIWLFGSTARNKNRYNSDVDIYAILKEEFNSNRIKIKIKNDITPDDYSLPEVDVHFGIKNIEDYKNSND